MASPRMFEADLRIRSVCMFLFTSVVTTIARFVLLLRRIATDTHKQGASRLFCHKNVIKCFGNILFVKI